MIIDESLLKGTLSGSFYENCYKAAQKNLTTDGGRVLKLFQILFLPHPTTGEIVMQLTCLYENSAGKPYVARWRYEFTENEDGTITFTNREQDGGGNAAAREPRIRAVLDFFCKLDYKTYSVSSWSKSEVSKVTPRTFKVNWVKNNTPGLNDMVGGYYYVSDPTNAYDASYVSTGVIRKMK